MNPTLLLNKSTNLPDAKVQDWFEMASTVCLVIASLTAITILLAWNVEYVATLLPYGWSMMQASTAFIILLLAAGITLSRMDNKLHLFTACRVCAGAVIVFAYLTLFEHLSGESAMLGQYLVADRMLPFTANMPVQTAICILLLSLTLMLDLTRTGKTGILADVLIMALVIINLVFISGYLFKVSALFNNSSYILVSPQTFICIALLTFVQTARRAPYGFFSVFITKGIGSHIARIVLPFSMAFSFFVIIGQKHLNTSNILSSPYDAAMSAVALAVILFIVVILLARKINTLETDLRNMSLTDELTGIYNRRGFYEHGERELRDARRSVLPLTILFFDVDNLKRVNDALGHDTGSQLLCDTALLLRTNFRDTDIVARIGGDEFAVISHGLHRDVAPALERLDRAINTLNRSGNKPYRIGFSVGEVTLEARNNRSLDELLNEADAEMYKNKQERHAFSGGANVTPIRRM